MNKNKYNLLVLLTLILTSCSPENIYAQGKSEGYIFYEKGQSMYSDGTNKKDILDKITYNSILYKSIYTIDTFYVENFIYLLTFAAENEYISLKNIYDNNKNDIKQYNNFLVKYSLIDENIIEIYDVKNEEIFDDIYLVSSNNIYVCNIENDIYLDIHKNSIIDKNLITDVSIELPILYEYENDVYKFYNEEYTSMWGVYDVFLLRYNKQTNVTEKMQSRQVSMGQFGFNYIKEK